MIHCTMEDLVALRGGEGTAWARKHVSECAACGREFEALHQRIAQLRALPTLNPPRDRWSVVRAGLVADRRRKQGVRARWAAMAVAASLVGVVTVQGIRQMQSGPVVTERASVNMGPLVDNLQELVSRSRALEEQLHEYDAGSRVMTGATAGAVAVLEDGIAAVDAELVESPAMQRDEIMDLWRRRVQLMEGLVNVHVARATYSGM